MVRITYVGKHSRAHKAGIKKDDVLLSINGNEINDVIDYRFYLADENLDLMVDRDSKRMHFSIMKEQYDDIGLDFETPLMDKKHSCKNKCIFCFIDQLPKGMRETLYFKDDDSRLSFLHGNYITLTNLTEADVDRIIKMRISPINISVHTMNPDLRVKMMKNKRAGEVLSYLDKIRDAHLTMRGQIVLCRGINDGEELNFSMKKLSEYYPWIDSVSVVPAGLTKYREGLYPLTQYTKEESRKIVETINFFGDSMKEKNGSRLFFPADEFYLKAELPLPDEEYYEGYPQIENGVGMLRSFIEEFGVAMDDLSDVKIYKKRRVSVATGVASYPFILKMAERTMSVFPNVSIRVYKIVNDFFGHQITVSGLLTGKDILAQLSGKDLGNELIIPSNCLRDGEDVFLCGMTLSELKKKLRVKIRVNDSDGGALVSAFLGK